MSSKGVIKSLYTDYNKSEALFPRTKVSAVSNDEGKGLNAILDQMQTKLDNAATEAFVKNEIANAQLGGGEGGVDLSGFATKDDVNALDTAIRNIDFPVDSINGKTGNVTLSAADIEAAPASIMDLVRAFGINTSYILDVPNSNFDALAGNSIYKGLKGNVQGFPSQMGEWCFVLTLHYDMSSMYGVQFAWDMNGYIVCNRYKREGIWSEWSLPNANAFAPSGYGLGSQAKFISNLDSATESGFYYFDEPSNAPFYYGTLIVAKRANNVVTQIAHQTSGQRGLVAFRVKDGNWQPWEYLNPRADDYQEYRTTKRYLDKPIYLRTFRVASIPINASTTVAHGIPNIDQPLSIHGYIAPEGNLVTFPYIDSASNWVGATFQKINCTFASGAQGGGVPAYVILEYTKTTD